MFYKKAINYISVNRSNANVIHRALVDVFVLHGSKLTVSFFYLKEEEMLCFLLCLYEPDMLDTKFLLALPMRHTF